jgi:hypothetical protein
LIHKIKFQPNIWKSLVNTGLFGCGKNIKIMAQALQLSAKEGSVCQKEI